MKNETAKQVHRDLKMMKAIEEDIMKDPPRMVFSFSFNECWIGFKIERVQEDFHDVSYVTINPLPFVQFTFRFAKKNIRDYGEILDLAESACPQVSPIETAGHLLRNRNVGGIVNANELQAFRQK